MAPSANILRQQYSLSRGIDRSSSTEVWEVADIESGGGPPWAPSNGTTSVLAVVPFAENDPHPDPLMAAKGVRLRDKRIIRQVRRDVAHVALIWDSARSYGFDLNATSQVSTLAGSPLMLPQFTAIAESAPGVPVSWAFQWVPGANRAVPVRTRYVYTAGSDADLVNYANQIEPNIGKRYFFNGVPFLLDSYSGVRFNNGQIRLIFRYQSKARVNAVASGTVAGFDVNLPALDYLDEYAPDRNTPPTAPTVGVLTAASQYGIGGLLP